VRRLTENDITPYSPIAARNSAATPNALNSVPNVP
jgi:hypothetical protein